MRNAKAGLALLALAQLTCHQALLTAPAGSTIAVFANPQFIPANGGASVISALVTEPAGTVVPDGTVVQFFTTLGRIDEQGKTNDGVARVNLVADSRSGAADVTAVSGSASMTVKELVKIGSALPAKVFVTAFPQRLTDQRSSLITANVVDDSGNPVKSVAVIFTVFDTASGNPSTELMDSQGSPTFTDTNGQAQDVMRTRYDLDAPSKSVTVKATTAKPGIEGTVVVTIN